MRIDRERAHCEISDGVATLYLNNPPANTLSSQSRADLRSILAEIKGMDGVRVLILTGEGDKFFCAGADIHEEAELKSPEEVTRFIEEMDALMEEIHNFPQPVIAAVNGYAIGGGFELMLSCDLRYVTLDARFAAAGVKMGLIASADSLPRLLGPVRAKELLFTARQIDGAEAERIGLANKAVPQQQLMDQALNVAREIAERAPLSVEAAKRVIHDTASLPRHDARQVLRTYWRRLHETEDHKEAVRAFKEKRQPRFNGR